MPALLRRAHSIRKSATALLALAALALCAFQFGDRYGLNGMPFAQVQRVASDLATAKKMATQGNIDLFVGQMIQGRTVNVRGEVTDANCYFGARRHAYRRCA